MTEPVKCASCGKPFDATFARCPFCDALARPAAAPTRRDYVKMAEEVIAGNGAFMSLEFHPAAVLTLDLFFDLTWGTAGKAAADPSWQPTEGQKVAILSFGVFLGDLLRREFGGAWEEDPEHPDNPYRTRVVLPGGMAVFPIVKVLMRLKNGAADGFGLLHQQAREMLGVTPTREEVPGWLRGARHFETIGRPDLATLFYERALVIGPAPPQRAEIELLLSAAREKARLAEQTVREAGANTGTTAGVEPAAAQQPPERPSVRPDAGETRRPAPELPPEARDPDAWLAEIAGIVDIGEAVEAYARFNEVHPEIAEPWRERGVGLAMLGRGEEALACFDRAAVLEPGVPTSFDHKAVTLARLDRLEEAVQALAAGLQHSPGSGVLLSRRGVFLSLLERPDEAMRAFEEAIRLDPQYPETWAFKGDLEQRQGRIADAAASFRHYLSVKGESQEKRVLVVRHQLQALEEREPPAP